MRLIFLIKLTQYERINEVLFYLKLNIFLGGFFTKVK